MRRDRPLIFEGLESRRLMAKVHPAAAPVVHAEVVTPLVLDGTLVIDNKATAMSQDGLGDSYQETPVSGVLLGVGKVKGDWTESADSYGDPLGPDTIQLQNGQGSFTINFSTANHGSPHKTATGVESFKSLTQHVHGGTKAYAHATETGTITVNTNASGKVDETMTLTSNPL